jgi:hypothetical protein
MIRTRIIYLFAALFFSIFLVSCQNNNHGNTNGNTDTVSVNGNNARENANKIWVDTKDYTYAQKDQFKQHIDSAKTELDHRIKELQQKAENASGNAKAEYNESVEKLKDERSYLDKKMNDIDNVSKDNWDDFKSGVNSAWNDINNTLSNIDIDVNVNGNG